MLDSDVTSRNKGKISVLTELQHFNDLKSSLCTCYEKSSQNTSGEQASKSNCQDKNFFGYFFDDQ